MNIYELIGRVVVWWTVGGIILTIACWVPAWVLDWCTKKDLREGTGVATIYYGINWNNFLEVMYTMRYRDPRFLARIYGEISIQLTDAIERKLGIFIQE